MPNFLEAPIEFKAVIELGEDAINGRHFLKFYYKSEPTNKNKNGNKGYRIIRPYMILPEAGALKLVGTPITELSKEISERQPGHYKISQLEQRLQLNQFEILPETFDDPGVPRSIIVLTKTPPVCRFIYNDEDARKVKAEWLKIKYVK
jgi:hypothetical protein